MPAECPKVTVLMPVYNGERYLKEAIESILNQTFTDFEFLIINDGSTDASEEIIRSYSDERIQLVNNRKNIKLIATLNKGLELARGKYIVRMDCDDIALQTRLEKQVQFMELHPEVGICGSWVEAFGVNCKGRVVIRYRCNDNEIKALYLFAGSIAHPTVIIRNEVFKKNNLFYDINYPHAEDFELWSKCRNITKFANIPEVLLKYRRTESSVSNIFRDKQIESTARVIFRNLREFGINVTEDEFNCHMAIVLGKVFKNKKSFIKQAEAWMLKLIEQNNISKVYPEKIFKEIVADNWKSICTLNAGQGISIFITYCKSDLLKYESKKLISIVKVFIYCIAKWAIGK